MKTHNFLETKQVKTHSAFNPARPLQIMGPSLREHKRAVQKANRQSGKVINRMPKPVKAVKA
jgi:hypothetical protein